MYGGGVVLLLEIATPRPTASDLLTVFFFFKKKGRHATAVHEAIDQSCIVYHFFFASSFDIASESMRSTALCNKKVSCTTEPIGVILTRWTVRANN